jgi:hypothetical protein
MIVSTFKIQNMNPDWDKKLIKSLGKLPVAKVGFNSPSPKHPGSKLSMANIAAKLEYGSAQDNITPRHFMRFTEEKNKGIVGQMLALSMTKILAGANAMSLMKIIAVAYEGMIRKVMLEDAPTMPGWELSPRTIKNRRKRKVPPPNQSTAPLVDTHQLIDNINSKVYIPGQGKKE